jgi:hypothetical protein
MSESSSDYAVVWPLSRQRTTDVGDVLPLESLSGKRIAFVWDYMFRGDEMWEIIKAGISAEYPTAEFVGYDKFGNIHGPTETGVPSDLLENIDREGVDAAVLAVGA